MENNSDFSNLRKLLEGFFGGSGSFYSASFRSERLLGDSDDSSDFPKDDDKNYNKVVETTETDTHSVKKETWTSLDGKSTYVRKTSTAKAKPAEENPKVKKELLERLLDEAIRKQQFEEAARIRDEIKTMK